MRHAGAQPFPLPDDGARDDSGRDDSGRDVPPPTAGAGTGAATGAEERLGAFFGEAARRKAAAQAPAPGDRPTDWVETDPATLARLLARRNPVEQVLKRFKAGPSRDNRRYVLRMACARLQGLDDHRALTDHDVLTYPWHELSVEAAADYRRLVYRTYEKQSTRNMHVCGVRDVVTQSFRAELISALRRDQLLDELYTIAPGVSASRRRLSSGEIAALMRECESNGTLAARARNTAIVALFRTSGMRSCELTSLALHDWLRDEEVLYLRDTKNGTSHRVYLHPDAIPYLERWSRVRGDFAGPLFTSLQPGADRTRFLGRRSIQLMLRTHADRAGIAPFGSHDFRRTFATELLRTHDVALVGKLLNHRRLASTLIYDLAGEEEQRAAVGKLVLPGIPAPPCPVGGEDLAPEKDAS